MWETEEYACPLAGCRPAAPKPAVTETAYSFHLVKPGGKGLEARPYVGNFSSKDEALEWLTLARRRDFIAIVCLVRWESTIVDGPYFHHLDPLAGRTE
jgi:hypothetical protein